MRVNIDIMSDLSRVLAFHPNINLWVTVQDRVFYYIQ